MIHIKESPTGCTFEIRVTPKARKPGVGGEHAGALKISVNAPPEDGKANAAVIAAIAKWLDTSKSNVDIVAGQTSRIKTIHVRGVEPTILRDMVRASDK